MSAVLMIFAFDTIFYAFVAYIVNSCCPGKYEKRKPWHVLLKVSYIYIFFLRFINLSDLYKCEKINQKLQNVI